MLVLIPTASDQVIVPTNMAALYQQTVPVVPIVMVSPSPVSYERNQLLTNICDVRTLCLKAMRAYGQTAAILDRDCLILETDTLALMQERLVEDSNLAVVVAKKVKDDDSRLTLPHLACGLWMYAERFLKLNIDFTHTSDRCECWEYADKIRAAGFKIEYADHKQRLLDQQRG